MAFRVSRLLDKDVIRAFLSVDRARYAYLLGDLADPYWSHSEYFGAFAGETLQAIVLCYMPIDPPPVLSAGEPEAVEAIYQVLRDQYALHHLLYHAQPEHMAALQRVFCAPDPIAIWRMVVTPDRFQNVSDDSVRRLTKTDADAAQTLFASFLPEDRTFPGSDPVAPGAAQLESGVCYGMFAENQLLALAGTHIISIPERIGAVGFVFTHPGARGKGYATRCTSAVTRHLFDLGIDLVALNVKQDNSPAIRAYERLGYRCHSPLYEGHAWVI